MHAWSSFCAKLQQAFEHVCCNVTGPGFYPRHFYICMYNLLQAASGNTAIKNTWAGLHKCCPWTTFHSTVPMLHTWGGRRRRVTFIKCSADSPQAYRSRTSLQITMLSTKPGCCLLANTTGTCLSLPAPTLRHFNTCTNSFPSSSHPSPVLYVSSPSAFLVVPHLGGLCSTWVWLFGVLCFCTLP